MLVDSPSYIDLIPDQGGQDFHCLLGKLHAITKDAVSRNLPDSSILSYSGGIDSSILNSIIGELGRKIQSITLGVPGSQDATALLETNTLAENDRFIRCIVDRAEVEEAAREVSRLVRVQNVSHFEDCVCFWLIGKMASSTTKAEFVVSANGPDELYCGYDRFRRILDAEGYPAVQNEIVRALDLADSLKREVKLVLSRFGLDSSEPLLDPTFRTFSISQVPIEFKILKGDDKLRKRIWRALGRNLGVPEQRVLQYKKAMQYSMGVHQIIVSLLKRKIISLDLEPSSSMQVRDSTK